MLAYFPTEQLYYLRIHDIIPAVITLPFLGKTVALNAKKLVQASSRFYLAYIVLEFFRLKERSGLLHAKERALSKANANSAEANAEKTELQYSWNAHVLAAAYNTFRFPGALHWYVDFYEPVSFRLLFGLHGLHVAPVVPSTLILNHPRLEWSPGSLSRLCFFILLQIRHWQVVQPRGCGHLPTTPWLFLSSMIGKISLHKPMVRRLWHTKILPIRIGNGGGGRGGLRGAPILIPATCCHDFPGLCTDHVLGCALVH